MNTNLIQNKFSPDPPGLTPEQQAVLDLLGRVVALEQVVRRLAGCVAVPEFRSIRGQAHGN